MLLYVTKATVKRTFLWLMVIAGFSSLITYHIGLLLPWTDEVEVHHHVRINRVLMKEVVDSVLVPHGSDKEDPIARVHQASQGSNTAILERLKQVEDRLQKIAAYRRVLTSGLHVNQTKVVTKVFTGHNYTVYNTDYEDGSGGEWSMVLSSRPVDGGVQKFQKCNHIPVVQEVVRRQDYLCYLNSIYSKIIDGYNTKCEAAPNINISENTTSKHNKYFTFTGEDVIQAYNSTNPLRTTSPIWYSDKELLKLDGRTVLLKIPVFVSSIFPLRIYMHSGKLLEWVQVELLKGYREQNVNSWLKSIKHSIVTSLLLTELLAYNRQHNYRHFRCFQTLEYNIVFRTDLLPIVVKVKPLSFPDSLDMIAGISTLLVAQERVAMEITIALGEMNKRISFGGQECESFYEDCLLESDLVYLLDNAMESKVTSPFIKLYPSLREDYSPSISKLQQIQMSERPNIRNGNDHIALQYRHPIPQFHSTPELHHLLHQVESSISSNVNYVEEDLLRSDLEPVANINRHLKSSDQKDYIEYHDEDSVCSSNPEDAVLLSNLKVVPSIGFNFDPNLLNYDLRVKYDDIVLQLHAKAKGCYTGIRFDDTNDSVSNYTLGVGDNIIKIHVMDMRGKQPVIINTYTINVYRPFVGQTGSPQSVLKTCILKQDCALKYSLGEECGLVPSLLYRTWNQFVATNSKLPYCKTYEDILDAFWSVPCKTCGDQSSCYWQQARWQPASCQHKSQNAVDVRRCFKGKKVLFIGDSTNRGIMHYILEKINGSLTNWDKTHDLKLYSSINDQQTTMSFAYYPQFWLPSNHRPGFDKAVFQLIKWTSPLENNSNTVLVVGGVHWLGKQHINVILNALKREGLTGIRLVMKGHGAGFHQHVEGVHYADLDHQQRLFSQEREVGRYADRHGFHVVPTFAMTMSRYKDFLQGKCACHFHKVTTKNRHGIKHYHIEGEINAAYSELIINAICHDHYL